MILQLKVYSADLKKLALGFGYVLTWFMRLVRNLEAYLSKHATSSIYQFPIPNPGKSGNIVASHLS